METESTPFDYSAKTRPIEALQQFIDVFANKGWVSQSLRIKHRDRRYRISCSERAFVAYRINDHCGISPGISGWAVCIVDHEQIIEDSAVSTFGSTEPSARDWLRCITDGDFEVLQEGYE